MERLKLALPENAGTEDIHPDDNYHHYYSALGKAIAYWRSGHIIPLSLAVELMDDGYDIGVLEARYLEV